MFFPSMEMAANFQLMRSSAMSSIEGLQARALYSGIHQAPKTNCRINPNGFIANRQNLVRASFPTFTRSEPFVVPATVRLASWPSEVALGPESAAQQSLTYSIASPPCSSY